MKRAALLSTALIIIPTITQAQCVNTTDCASLGYTETFCPDGGLKCPFGNTWSCKESNCSSNQETYDKNDDINCTYGSIYYNDGICMKEFVSGRIPIGIVAYIDPINKEKWITSTSYVVSNIYWGNQGDIPEITNYTSASTVVSDIKSCENTAAMLQYNSEAAQYVLNYAPEGAEATKGKWCIPTVGMFNMIARHLTEIDDGLTKINGYILHKSCPLVNNGRYWTSSEVNSENAWYWKPPSTFEYTEKDGNIYGTAVKACIRAVMKL